MGLMGRGILDWEFMFDKELGELIRINGMKMLTLAWQFISSLQCRDFGCKLV